MFDDCEASNARILESFNTTLHTLNTTGLSTLHVEWLKGNTTNNVTSGLQKCDLETFLTDVGVNLDSFSMHARWFCALFMNVSILGHKLHAGQNMLTQFISKDFLITITKVFKRFAKEIKTSYREVKYKEQAAHNRCNFMHSTCRELQDWVQEVTS